MVGSMFTTRIFLFQTRLMPMQKIMIDPVSDRFASACSVISGWMSLASSVMHP